MFRPVVRAGAPHELVQTLLSRLPRTVPAERASGEAWSSAPPTGDTDQDGARS